MPLRKRRPEDQHTSIEHVPDLTHQSSSESIRSPITPSDNTAINPLESKLHKLSTANLNMEKDHPLDAYPLPPLPQSAPPTTSEFKFPNSEPESPKVPPKDLAFLSQDPFAQNHQDDDIIPFDKNQPITLSRSKSGRSIMSMNSIQSLKRGLSTLKRKLTQRSRSRPPGERRLKSKEPGAVPSAFADDPQGIMPVGRAQTYMQGPSFNSPRRVETFQMSAMII